jgi:hypothetical protein
MRLISAFLYHGDKNTLAREDYLETERERERAHAASRFPPRRQFLLLEMSATTPNVYDRICN